MKKKFTYAILFILLPASLLFTGCFGNKTFKIELDQLDNCAIYCDLSEAKAGEEITLTYDNLSNGYVFEYYTINGEELVGDAFIMPNEDVKVSAVLSKITYTITYHVDEFTSFVNQNSKLDSYTIGTSASLPQVQKTGYEFDSWYSDSQLQNGVEDISSEMYGDLDLYPKFNKLFNVDSSTGSITSLTSIARNKSELKIPEKIDGVTITTIEANAFTGAICTTLKISKKITTFKKDAFAGCYSVKNLYYSGDLADWVKLSFPSNDEGQISSNPIWWSTSAKVYLNNVLVGEELVFPDEIKSVGLNAFYRWGFLKKVKYEGQLEDWLKITFSTVHSSPLVPVLNQTAGPKLMINESAVGGDIAIPSTISSIQPGALAWTNIETVNLNSSVRYICDGAFYNCKLLGNINLIDSQVATIGDYAFYGCIDLKINLPSKLVSIGKYAFAESCKWYGSESSVVISNYTTTIGVGAFNNCTYLTHVTIGSGLSVIEESCFEGSGLETITIPNTINEIGKFAFRGCENLLTVYIKKPYSSNVIKGGEDMFKNTGVTGIYFEDNEHKNLYQGQTYWNLYTSYFKVVE